MRTAIVCVGVCVWKYIFTLGHKISWKPQIRHIYQKSRNTLDPTSPGTIYCSLALPNRNYCVEVGRSALTIYIKTVMGLEQLSVSDFNLNEMINEKWEGEQYVSVHSITFEHVWLVFDINLFMILILFCLKQMKRLFIQNNVSANSGIFKSYVIVCFMHSHPPLPKQSGSRGDQSDQCRQKPEGN